MQFNEMLPGLLASEENLQRLMDRIVEVGPFFTVGLLSDEQLSHMNISRALTWIRVTKPNTLTATVKVDKKSLPGQLKLCTLFTAKKDTDGLLQAIMHLKETRQRLLDGNGICCDLGFVKLNQRCGFCTIEKAIIDPHFDVSSTVAKDIVEYLGRFEFTGRGRAPEVKAEFDLQIKKEGKRALLYTVSTPEGQVLRSLREYHTERGIKKIIETFRTIFAGMKRGLCTRCGTTHFAHPLATDRIRFADFPENGLCSLCVIEMSIRA
jgi:hypothetical protein